MPSRRPTCSRQGGRRCSPAAIRNGSRCTRPAPGPRVFRALPGSLHADVTVAAVGLRIADREVAEEAVCRILALNEGPRHVLDFLGGTGTERQRREDRRTVELHRRTPVWFCK